jgi:hypothetical protein
MLRQLALCACYRLLRVIRCRAGSTSVARCGPDRQCQCGSWWKTGDDKTVGVGVVHRRLVDIRSGSRVIGESVLIRFLEYTIGAKRVRQDLRRELECALDC